MAEQLCPVCGCTVAGEGHEKQGVTYCCEPCSTSSGSACECGCCEIVEEPEKKG